MNTHPVGASLLAMTATRSTSMQADPPLSRASSLPQGVRGVHKTEASPRHCGSELARDEDRSLNIIATDPPLSRAGSLPQGACVLLGPGVST
ncbi:hypothetical protein D3C75_1117980 [compost metagenome]